MEMTVHINFVNRKQFLAKDRIFGLFLDFIYDNDYYKIFHAKYGLYDRKDLLATLYASDASLMEELKCVTNSNSHLGSLLSPRVPRIIYNTLIVDSQSDHYVPFTIDDLDRNSIYPNSMIKMFL